MRFLLDENIPRSLRPALIALGHEADDVRDIGLRGHPDTEVLEAAEARDAVIITRDRGFTFEKSWPEGFTAGAIFVSLPDDASATVIVDRLVSVIGDRLPASLLGAVTTVEIGRAVSRQVRKRR